MGKPREIILAVAFWGEEFREHFYSLLLPTLLAPGNLPALKRHRVRLLVYTTPEDWAVLFNRSLVRELACIEPIFIDLPGACTPLMHATDCQSAAIDEAFERKALFGSLTPDMVFSDGLLQTAVTAIEGGSQVVVCPALRCSEERVRERVKFVSDQPCSIPSSGIGRIVAASLHPEIQGYDFREGRFDYVPIWTYWRSGEDIVMYTASWAAVLSDYAHIPAVAAETLRHSTVDGYFTGSTFGHLMDTAGVTVLRDSTEGMLLGLTPQNNPRFAFKPSFINAVLDRNGLHNWRKHRAVYRFHHGPMLDPWRRWLHTVPALLHSGDISGAYAERIATSQRVMEALVGAPPLTEQDLGAWKRLKLRVILRLDFVSQMTRFVVDTVRQVNRGEKTVGRVFRRVLNLASWGLLYRDLPRLEFPELSF